MKKRRRRRKPQQGTDPAIGSDRPSGGSGTRADLIAAGRKLFARRGYDGASVRAITTEAGANLGAVTYHFGSKRDLYGAVLEEGLRPLALRVAAAAEAEGPPMDRMIGVVEAYFAHLRANPDVPHLLLQEVAAGKQPPPIVLEIIDGLKSMLARLHAEGVEEGSMRTGHPLLTALSVVSQPIYFTLIAPLARTVGGLDLADPRTHALALEHVTTFVRAGLAPREEGNP